MTEGIIHMTLFANPLRKSFSAAPAPARASAAPPGLTTSPAVQRLQDTSRALNARPEVVAQRALSERLSAAPAAMHARPFVTASAPAQLGKKKKKQKSYAADEKEARALMLAYAEKVDVEVGEKDLLAAIAVAVNRDYGIDEGEKIILQSKVDANEAEARDGRKARFTDDYDEFESTVTLDRLCAAALAAAFQRYVANPPQPNLTLGGTYSQDDIDEALIEWKGFNGVVTNVRFWGFSGEDKAALGKGNVGPTLETRDVQANLLSSWGGTEINVHINVAQ